jgi:exopolyphosphatase / guanosine-5'-triphosphate,3'-diphosphate pyrophosphatase
VTVDHRTAIVDIGSNSIRLVVYGGPARAPVTLYNEKLLAGLGRDLQKTGLLNKASMADSIAALARFKHLVGLMNVPELRVVATAAVRDAANGADFIARVAEIGLHVEVLSGDAEAVAAGYGVVAGNPMADGIAGDLGGGSLELVRVKNGEVHERASFPLGTLRLPALRTGDARSFETHIKRLLKPHPWLQAGQGLPFYMVGGSWRSLARLHIHKTHYPLPVLSNYVMSAKAAAQILRMTATLDKSVMKQVPTLSTSRLPMLADAAALLALIAKILKPSSLVSCAFGLREGLLFERLSPERREEDPLVQGARFEGVRQGRFGAHGDDLHHWIAPLFAHEAEAEARVRHAACLLADIAWSANPEFRAEHGMETALHGNWIGVSARDRAMLAMTLYASLGGPAPGPAVLDSLATPEELATARIWGLAMRLGQRVGGGTEAALRHSRLGQQGGVIYLDFDSDHADLGGDNVFRRLKQLASALGCTAEMTKSPA